jgi:ABC-type transporter Mla subunit MlaD
VRRALVIGALIFAVVVAIVFGAGAGNDDGGDYKVRAIFDNASFLIPGQDVKIAGAKVGVVEDLDVQQTADGNSKAAVVMRIDEDGFKDFRTDAQCAIRLQSVIGEKLVECTPTRPGSTAPPLRKIPDGQPGAGQRLLPVESTSTPVDADLINNIQRRPFRERFSILLNELGAGLAARAEDIQEVIRRGNPALREFDEFLAILAGQNKMLGRLTKDADEVLTALSRKRRELADFFVQSGIAAEATAEKRVDLERNFERFPRFLRQLRPFMDRFEALSAQMAPVVSDLRVAAPDLSRFLIALGPFSQSSNVAIKSLGRTADIGRTALVNAKPVAESLARFTKKGRGVADDLATLFTSLDQHRGIERFLDTLYYVALSTNGFDSIGHYLRNNLVVTICSGYVTTPTVGCSANFVGAGASSSSNPLATSSSLPRAVASGLLRVLGESDRPRRKPKRPEPKPQATERRPAKAPQQRSSGDPAGTTGAGGATGQSGAQGGAEPPAPAAPAPERQAAPERPAGDPLLDYYLGGQQ